jgi:hypothetical protein
MTNPTVVENPQTGQQESAHSSIEEVGRLIQLFQEKFGDAAEEIFRSTVRITFTVERQPSALESLWKAAP